MYSGINKSKFTKLLLSFLSILLFISSSLSLYLIIRKRNEQNFDNSVLKDVSTEWMYETIEPYKLTLSKELFSGNFVSNFYSDNINYINADYKFNFNFYDEVKMIEINILKDNKLVKTNSYKY